MCTFEFQTRTRIIFGEGAIDRLGALARELKFRRPLLVADHGLQASGHVAEASQSLAGAGIEPVPFHDFESNPDTNMVEAGRVFAATAGIDSIIGLGGGSSMDCAKAINFVLTNGGSMRDYRGHGKASKAMLPSIGIPTTAGTGSEAQSVAIISDAETHAKMACGDEKAMFRVVILDPVLTVSQPRDVTAIAGYDALSHATEAFVTSKRNDVSSMLARDAFGLLEPNYERVLAAPDDLEAREAMLRGHWIANTAPMGPVYINLDAEMQEAKLAEPIGPLPRMERSPDPTDDFLLALSEAGKADYLVTGNKGGLLALARHRATRIISARDFAALLA